MVWFSGSHFNGLRSICFQTDSKLLPILNGWMRERKCRKDLSMAWFSGRGWRLHSSRSTLSGGTLSFQRFFLPPLSRPGSQHSTTPQKRYAKRKNENIRGRRRVCSSGPIPQIVQQGWQVATSVKTPVFTAQLANRYIEILKYTHPRPKQAIYIF
jgi:hypothetical protein